MVHIFPLAIGPKVNATAWLGFELAYYDIACHEDSLLYERSFYDKLYKRCETKHILRYF